ncbi:MAG: pcpB [Xanthobacteraceae bacterium]|jgi:2-polyprenyl-6-methoxyphenol hydroxylase-like FAD-dependent oxidoreductase|nr:pcpB [Xanthobacteraceae bacterium]
MTDDGVLICGAGPVGLTLAVELARFGVPVRIVEKAAARTDKSKAVAIWCRSLELFARAGLADRLVAAGNVVPYGSILAGTETIAELDFAELETPYPFALLIPQPETERILEEHLGTLGVEVERQTELTTFKASDAGVSATLRAANGSERQLAAAWLVGCDGAHSTVRHGLGFDFEGATQMSDWVLADLMLAGPVAEDRILIYWHADGILAIFPLGAGRFRVVADLGPARQEGRRADPTLAEVQALIDGRGLQGIVGADPNWLACFRINERKVARYGQGRVFLAGDAAHVHSPAGGQGMNTGMQDAFNLAWKLALVHAGGAGPALLDSYSIERSAVGDEVLSNATRLTDVALLRNPLAQAVRNRVAHFVLGLSQVRRRAERQLGELDIAYEASPLSVSVVSSPQGLPDAGERLPAAPAGMGARALFAVLGSAGEPAALAAEYPHLVDAETGDDPPGEGLWIVRPDGYVGLVAAPGDLPSAQDYLEAIGRGR